MRDLTPAIETFVAAYEKALAACETDAERVALAEQVAQYVPAVDSARSLPDEWVRIPLHRLVKASWNYKEDDEEKARKLSNNIRRNGQIVNLVVRELPDQTDQEGKYLYEIGDGNHRLDALEDAGQEFAVCYNCGPCSVEELQRKAIEINETQFESDGVALGGLIAGLNDVFDRMDLLDTMPFNAEEWDDFVQMGDFDWDQFDTGFDGPFGEDEGELDEEGFVTVTARLPESAHEVYNTARLSIRERLEADGQQLHDDEALGHGQVLEALAAEYLASTPA